MFADTLKKVIYSIRSISLRMVGSLANVFLNHRGHRGRSGILLFPAFIDMSESNVLHFIIVIAGDTLSLRDIYRAVFHSVPSVTSVVSRIPKAAIAAIF